MIEYVTDMIWENVVRKVEENEKETPPHATITGERSDTVAYIHAYNDVNKTEHLKEWAGLLTSTPHFVNDWVNFSSGFVLADMAAFYLFDL